MALELPKLVERLREAFPTSAIHEKPKLNPKSSDDPLPRSIKDTAKVLTRRTG